MQSSQKTFVSASKPQDSRANQGTQVLKPIAKPPAKTVNEVGSIRPI